MALFEKLMVSSASPLRQIIAPASSGWSSRKVPSRTPNALAILMRGAKEGISIFSSIRAICSIDSPVRSASSSADFFYCS